ncbi:MAG: type III pantothenate kinase [Deltaproteobacteria bacterium]|jgi:type III pantothenate kinase|nr:type III pantothenate kinase [Deltaproteobacteria bacterium]
MLLTLDVGNTNIKFGLFRGNELVAVWRASTRKNISGDELGLALDGYLRLNGYSLKVVTGFIVASVVPPMRPAIERLGARYLGLTPIFVEAHSQDLMPILYSNPREVGADRVLVSIAAFKRFQRALVIVDFGTATTFDCVSEKGEYLGGAIAPGFRLSAEALFQTASRLPKMEQFSAPQSAICRDTLNSLNSGLVLGYAGLVEGLVNRIRAEMDSEPLVTATGGLASLIAEQTKVIEIILPDLTMEGLKIIYDAQKGSPKA